MVTVKILLGIPGSGKTTYARKAWPSVDLYVSADDAFTSSGRVHYDLKRLDEVHRSLFRRYIDAVQRWHDAAPPGRYLIVVDNTNTSMAEVAPYLALALAYGCDVEVFAFLCDPRVAADRNVHSVPTNTIEKMARQIERLRCDWPQRWPLPTVIFSDEEGP